MGIYNSNMPYMLIVFLVYKISKNYDAKSKVLLGVATDQNEILSLCIRQAGKEGWTLSGNNIHQLIESKATNSYSGSGEFIFEEAKLNKLFRV